MEQRAKRKEQSPEELDDWMDGRLDGSEWIHAGKRAKAAIYSFNGNKIITTSGGGMLASEEWGTLLPYEPIKKKQQGQVHVKSALPSLREFHGINLHS